MHLSFRRVSLGGISFNILYRSKKELIDFKYFEIILKLLSFFTMSDSKLLSPRKTAFFLLFN
jgi:hypothetical protein